MNLEQLDSQQLQQLESRLFEEFTELDQLIAAKQRQLRQIEAVLTAIVTERQSREDQLQLIGRPLQEVDVDRAVSPPVYVDERLPPPEDPSTSEEEDVFRSGPFEIRRDESGAVDTVTCNLGHHLLVVERNSETTASWGIREKTKITSILHCLSPQSISSSSPP